MTRINEPGPVTCNEKGEPICERRKDLVEKITSEVTHPDKFNPTIKWKIHKERVIAMFKKFQEEWSLPDNGWKWFNRTANERWSDHKNRNLKVYFNNAKGNFIQAVNNRPRGLVNEENWLALCEHFRAISEPDPQTGTSKSANCSSSRKKSKQNHGFGRTAIAVWVGKFIAKYNKEPTAAHVFDKGYIGIDALKLGEDPSTSHQHPTCADPQLLEISANLHKGVQDRINGGVESSVASSETVLQIFGKPKLGILHHKIRKGQPSTKQTRASLQLTASQAHIQTLESRMRILESFMQRIGQMPMPPSELSGSEDEEDEEDEEREEDMQVM